MATSSSALRSTSRIESVVQEAVVQPLSTQTASQTRSEAEMTKLREASGTMEQTMRSQVAELNDRFAQFEREFATANEYKGLERVVKFFGFAERAALMRHDRIESASTEELAKEFVERHKAAIRTIEQNKAQFVSALAVLSPFIASETARLQQALTALTTRRELVKTLSAQVASLTAEIEVISDDIRSGAQREQERQNKIDERDRLNVELGAASRQLDDTSTEVSKLSKGLEIQRGHRDAFLVHVGNCEQHERNIYEIWQTYERVIRFAADQLKGAHMLEIVNEFTPRVTKTGEAIISHMAQLANAGAVVAHEQAVAPMADPRVLTSAMQTLGKALIESADALREQDAQRRSGDGMPFYSADGSGGLPDSADGEK